VFIFFSTNSINSITSNSVLNVDVPNGPIHWHPILKVIVDGKQIEIPEGIGLGSVHQPIHTHDNAGIIHMEIDRPRADLMVLGAFFKIWDKTFNKDCIFEYCTDKGTLKMTVNEKENNEFENYPMKDGDQIVIEYTSK
jgi:hypothetical protein